MAERTKASWFSKALAMASGAASHSRVDPSMSVNRNVAVPVGAAVSAGSACHRESFGAQVRPRNHGREIPAHFGTGRIEDASDLSRTRGQSPDLTEQTFGNAGTCVPYEALRTGVSGITAGRDYGRVGPD